MHACILACALYDMNILDALMVLQLMLTAVIQKC